MNINSNQFRDYSDNNQNNLIREHYRLLRKNQTVEYNIKIRQQFQKREKI